MLEPKRLPHRSVPLFMFAVICASIFSSSTALADPMDGFFDAGPQADVAQEQVSSFFDDVNAVDTDIGIRLAKGVNLPIATMRLAGNTWWSASDETRERFLAALSISIADRFRQMDIQRVIVDEIRQGSTERVIDAISRIILPNEQSLSVTWSLREDQGTLAIIAAQTPEGTLLLPVEARAVMTEDTAELEDVLQVLLGGRP